MNELAVIQKQFEPLLPRLEAALGPATQHLPLPRLMQTIWVSIEQNPKLLDANRQSLFNAALTFAFLGLEVDGATGQGYLIPFKNRVQPVIGYKGYNTLGARSGLTINGDVIREGDRFEFALGSNPFCTHVPKLGEPGRKVIGAWATASSNTRPPIIAVMGIDELLEVKRRAPNGNQPPWSDPAVGFPAMCQKTVKRRLARGMPLNVFQYAARLEEQFDEQGVGGWIDPSRGVVAEREETPPPTSTMLTQEPEPQPAEETAPDNVSRETNGAAQTEQAFREPAGAPAPLAGDVSGNLGRFRIACSSACEEGTAKLQSVWKTIPFEYRASLQATYDKQWWTRALLADRRASEREEKDTLI